ncbi:helix-turn-helix domain-containing protein [Thalassobellus sediminis]|uniref:helix-turn-helix domain-containing protein n=1 Tax=Thalassobellus sediminis TaxID=3367753 RepID=UPI00378E5926
MKRKSIFLILPILSAIVFLLLVSTNNNPQDHFSEMVKVALRDAGNKILLANNDSTSLILPITKLNENRYEIAFQNKLLITPDSLVSIISNSLKTADLPKKYIVEVVNCNSKEVSYSFQIKELKEQNITPCLGRNLPTDCYTIQVLFIKNNSFLSKSTIFLILAFILIGIVGVLLFYKKREEKTKQTDTSYSKIGNYKFYKDQNKLIKDSIEIKLSAKECDLMAMFSANQNQIIKRETLIKEIWEDHGVYVDRSLDTFISKLRKKFKDDNTINIVNIHGVGYKLEVS